ncbi:MAG: hypothetical protein Q7O66_04015 [Dehalococcoidia bacterium]|nr:hypothetical protein [Dehalococcoidia bacterium]
MATAAEIAAWVQAIGWPDASLGTCVGRAFADEHGGRLPLRAELCPWANVTGRRKSDGSWVCIPATTGGLEMPDLNEWLTNARAKTQAWVYAHPILGLGSLAAIVLLISQQAGKRQMGAKQ